MTSTPRIPLLPLDEAKEATKVAGISGSGILTSLEVPLEDGVMSWPPHGEGPA